MLMWAGLKLFFRSNALAIIQRGAIILGAIGAIAAVYRAGGKAEENENTKKELGYAKEIIKQDATVAGNSDVDGMRLRLSEALRRKRRT